MSLSSWLNRDRFFQGFPVLPGALPVVGHLPILVYDAIGVIQRGAQKLGPVFWVRMGPSLQALFLVGTDCFEVLKSKSVIMRGAFTGLERMIGESTIVQDGAPHARMRGVLNPSFSMRGLVTTGVGAIMAQVVSERVDGWVRQRSVVSLKETQQLALDIIFRACGVPTDELPWWHQQNREMSLLVIPIRTELPLSPRRRGLRAADAIDGGLLKIIQRARHEPDGKSMVHSMVAARDEHGQGLSDQQLVDNMRVLTFAGHETTASVLAWLTLMLAQRRELWEKLCEEVQAAGAVVPTSIAEAKAYPFGEALFREALRRYGPLWMTRRKLTAELHYGGHRIPEGTAVALLLGSLMMDPERYPNPERFDPGRWLGRPSPPTPIEMAGFGGGAHFCLGYHLAWLEVQQFLVALAQKMTAAGLRPRMPDGPGPKEVYYPVRHPGGSTRVDFVPR